MKTENFFLSFQRERFSQKNSNGEDCVQERVVGGGNIGNDADKVIYDDKMAKINFPTIENFMCNCNINKTLKNHNFIFYVKVETLDLMQ